MDYEGQEHSYMTGVYWTLTVMSTLGFGDITFETDVGRFFSIIVLGTGAIFILVLLPFAFIQFVFMPWMEARNQARAPRSMPKDMNGHIVLTQLGVVTRELIRRAKQANIPYVLIVPDVDEALRLHDEGFKAMVGPLDDPETYRAARVDQAALVATTQPDTTNTNIAFTVREFNADVPILATSSSPAAADVLSLAGCNVVLQLGELLGTAMARRVFGGDAHSHVVGEFGDLLVAEASVADTQLEGAAIRDLGLRQATGVNIAGVWQRGVFELPHPDNVLESSDVLILVGSPDQLKTYDDTYGRPHELNEPVIVIGGGRVGRAAARVLGEAGVDCRIIEERMDRIRDADLYIRGDAADLQILHEARISEASAVLITTHDDDVNVYLTILSRRLRPDMQIIARANHDRNVATLHRAGADSILSYASIGATSIWNTLGDNDTLIIADGLEMFRTSVPPAVVGKTLIEAGIRQNTGCNVVAIESAGHMIVNPDPTETMAAESSLVIIGDSHAQQEFMDRFPAAARESLPSKTT